MSEDTPLIQSMRAAVQATPGDVALRLHLAELLLDAGQAAGAVAEVAVALQHAPDHAQARELMARAIAPPPAAQAPAPSPAPSQVAAPDTGQATNTGQAASTDTAGPGAPRGGFDWQAAENEVGDVVPPRFVEAPLTVDGSGDPGDADAWEVAAPGTVRLADVGGMRDVKERLEAAFLAPLRNPELRKLYGKSLRGGLLLYGPPGCGKTFIARAVAGELGANFLSVSVNDVLDMWIGNSERNMHEIFQTARRQAPCVVFLDELDALGGKRSRTQHSGMRNTVNQLLTELDGVDATANEGVFVLAATNVPWDVDIALRRPGRLDRTLLVLPPDAPAREAILRYHLKDRPIESVDLGKLVKITDGLSGADLAHVCEAAAEHALLDSARTGTVRLINMADLLRAAKAVAPSTEPWFATARNVAMYANEGGTYDDLVAYLKRKRKL
ncbi:ATP-binding protein [Streptomyces sp. AC536]|uniref:ATP-binding protein n=1 Tax=Streptomyces buecherae TaxID=2763006 RepID=UPI00164E7CBB|nr:ATP-binding protein [Streptomyces buecherae]MBC3982568.1 ATP-binding protein [Streptomyces buecherae]QNJ40071.1 ATP-binding protein [Streptomyces buecherae]